MTPDSLYRKARDLPRSHRPRRPMTLSETGRFCLICAMWAMAIGGFIGWAYVERENYLLRIIAWPEDIR